MGLVRDYLVAQIESQLREHHVVVWFDPERHYSQVAAELKPGGVRVVLYDESRGYLRLRRELEPLWSGMQAPQLLLYVPIAEQDTHHALIEYTVAGVVMQPGQQPQERNTRLGVVARRALEPVLPAATLSKLAAEVEHGRLTLAELDNVAERYRETNLGALAVVYGLESSDEIVLRFLTRPGLDEAVRAKDSVAALKALLKGEVELELAEEADLAQTRSALGRHLLSTEFIGRLAAVPTALSTVPQPKGDVARETATRLVRTWQLRSDLADQYAQVAQRVELELGLTSQAWTLEALAESVTFPGIEAIVQGLTEAALLDAPSDKLVAFAQQRAQGFWASQSVVTALRWQTMAQAGQVVLRAKQIRSALKLDLDAVALVQRYVGPEDAWCQLDTLYRRLERDEHNLDVDMEADDTRHRLLAAARHAYADVLDTLTDRFVHAYERAGLHLSAYAQQNATYRDFVQPAVQAGRTAYLLVDSLRYEMALELFEQVRGDWGGELVPAIATSPTITEVGMAALMPGAERGMSLLPAGSGKLAVQVLDSVLKGRAERVQHLKTHYPEPLVVTELSAIAPLRDKCLSKVLASAHLAVVTASDEIDGLWETHPDMARRLQEDVYSQLRRGLRTLFALGFHKAVITADHGFISGDGLMSGTPMDPPGGDTADLHRRVWVGKGGDVIASCLRKPVSAFGLGGDLELVTSYGLGCFKVPGGSTQYFHGGLALQEVIVPILVLSAGRSKASVSEPRFQWSLSLGSKQISTRFCTVTIAGSAQELFAQPPRIRAELRSGEQLVSTPVAATYGFDEVTRDVTMRFKVDQPKLAPNTITLHVAEVPGTPTVTLHILDSETGVSLEQVKDIPVAMAF